MAKKYYVVWVGRKTGIFESWDACKKQVDSFTGAKFKSFPALSEAEAAFGTKLSGHKPKIKPDVVDRAPLTEADIAALDVEVKIFSDGACFPNPGESGSGVALYRANQLSELWYGLYNSSGTNNTAELGALHHALLAAKDERHKGFSAAIFSDSLYSIKCVTVWAGGWKKRNWKKSGGDVKNLDLIVPMHELYEELNGEVRIYHVNGHVGVEGNELADRMSAFAIEAREEGLRRFTEPMAISEILAMKAG